MIRWANGNDQEPAPQTKKASSSEEVRASALRLSSQMALSLRLQLRTTEFMLLLSIYYRRSMGDPLFETKEPLVGLTSLPCSDYGYSLRKAKSCPRLFKANGYIERVAPTYPKLESTGRRRSIHAFPIYPREPNAETGSLISESRPPPEWSPR